MVFLPLFRFRFFSIFYWKQYWVQQKANNNNKTESIPQISIEWSHGESTVFSTLLLRNSLFVQSRWYVSFVCITWFLVFLIHYSTLLDVFFSKNTWRKNAPMHSFVSECRCILFWLMKSSEIYFLNFNPHIMTLMELEQWHLKNLINLWTKKAAEVLNFNDNIGRGQVHILPILIEIRSKLTDATETIRN